LRVFGEKLGQRAVQDRGTREIYDDDVGVAEGVHRLLRDDPLVQVDGLRPPLRRAHRGNHPLDLVRGPAAQHLVALAVEDVVAHARIRLKRSDVGFEGLRSLRAKDVRLLPRPQIHAGAVLGSGSA